MVRYGLLTVNILILGSIGLFVLRGSTPASTARTPLASGAPVTNPLDQLSASEIAVNVSLATALPQTVAVINHADSMAATATVASADTAVIAKQQAVATNFKSAADIQLYIVKEGDTLSSIAAEFNVTSDSISWSNDLGSSTVSSGDKLLIPPVNGIIHTVVQGDTVDSLASHFSANKNQIIAFNDIEISGLKVGKRVVIPGGQQPAPVVVASSYQSFRASYGYNGYDPGWCTWYVASRVSVPTNWGNANTWDDRARVTPGWTVSTAPRPGAIAQRNGGWAGHVGYVEDVSADGTMIKYSDMNGLAGFDRVGYSGWVPASSYDTYIYR